MKIDYPSVVAKFGILGAILALLPFPWSILACLAITWAYQYAIALFYGVSVMPTMDTMCFAGDNDIRVNFMSCTVIERNTFES